MLRLREYEMFVLQNVACNGSQVIGGGNESVAVDSGDTEGTAETIGDPETGSDTDTGEPPDDGEDEAYAAFYDMSVIQQVVIEVSRQTMNDMDVEAYYAYSANPSDPELSYWDSNVLINGERYDHVGLRLKGSSTFQYWDGKPSLKVKFNEYDDTVRFAGLKRATFNNMTGDPAMAREVIGYKFWRDAGMAVPQANFCQLYVAIDGEEPEYFGLYTNLEAMDSEWIERNYEDDAGDLWEGNDYADFSSDGIGNFELVTGPGDTDALDEARRQVQNHGDDFYSDVNDVLDMDQFLDFWAFSVAIGNRDGYPFNQNDFFIYHNPADGRFNFSPWGMDESWDDYTQDYWYYVNGAVAQYCLYYDATCPERYYEAQAQALDLYEAYDFPALTQAMIDLTEQAMADDPRKNWGGYAMTTRDVDYYRENLLYKVEIYPGMLRTAIGL